MYPVLKQEDCSCSTPLKGTGEFPADTLAEGPSSLKKHREIELLKGLKRGKAGTGTTNRSSMVMSRCSQYLSSTPEGFTIECDGNGVIDGDIMEKTRRYHEKSTLSLENNSQAAENSLVGPSRTTQRNSLAPNQRSFQAGVNKWLKRLEQSGTLLTLKTSMDVPSGATATTTHPYGHTISSINHNWKKCVQVSRLAVLKNRPNGSVFTYLQLDDSLDRLRTSVHLSKMEYAGCDLELNPLCRSAVANAYVLATTLHSLDSVDRKRAVMFLTSRTSAQIHSIEYDLREAVKYAARNLFEVYALSIGEQSSEGEIGSFVSAPTLKNANMIHGLNGRIVPRSLPFVLLGI
ncbi:unnamed protein product [Toxocara canis]|uniref:VWFA domain-containing protein n=1 Tax=Toxocara canis TaxID=6265 RepID=A0A183UM91_TOXCA|nr:unnamed protein product [Toxocara canis]